MLQHHQRRALIHLSSGPRTWSCPFLNDAARALDRSRLMAPLATVQLLDEALPQWIILSCSVSKQLVLLTAA